MLQQGFLKNIYMPLNIGGIRTPGLAPERFFKMIYSTGLMLCLTNFILFARINSNADAKYLRY